MWFSELVFLRTVWPVSGSCVSVCAFTQLMPKIFFFQYVLLRFISQAWERAGERRIHSHRCYVSGGSPCYRETIYRFSNYFTEQALPYMPRCSHMLELSFILTQIKTAGSICFCFAIFLHKASAVIVQPSKKSHNLNIRRD